jgi:hypothetical protein
MYLESFQLFVSFLHYLFLLALIFRKSSDFMQQDVSLDKLCIDVWMDGA